MLANGVVFMIDNIEQIAKDILEISSEQRLKIILKLYEKKSKLSEMAKELNATAPEVFRNMQRLTTSEIITKDSEGRYNLTTYGNTVHNLLPTIIFPFQNKEYFKDHDFGNLPSKFLQRIGALSNSQLIVGVSMVLERWKEIFQNANEYIYGILYEEPLDLIEPIIEKAKNGIKVNSIFSESAIIPKGRKKILADLGFDKVIQDGIIERKMKKDVKVIVVLNEKQACVTFPFSNGEVDMSKMFFSSDSDFHEWCLDYFRYCWYGSDSFHERKIKE